MVINVTCTFFVNVHNTYMFSFLLLGPVTAQDESTTSEQMSTAIPTNNSTTSSDDSGGSTSIGLPIALIFSFALIGALFLVMLILVGITIICCVARKRTSSRNRQDIVRRSYDRQNSQVLVGNAEQKPANSEQKPANSEKRPANSEHRPSQETKSPSHDRSHTYSQVNKLKKKRSEDGSSPPPPLPPPLVFTPSPQPSMKPQEIVSYNTDIPKTFIPYAPPPPVSGLASSEKIHKVNMDNNPYNIPMDSLADYDEVDSFDGSAININVNVTRKTSRAFSLQSYPGHGRSTPSDDDSYYDTVESIHESPALVSSLQLSPYRGGNESHYQSPRRRPGRYSEGNNPPYNVEPMYIEALEPSMMHSSSSMSNETPLPYAPIYDCPKYLKKTDQPLEVAYHNIMEIRNLGNCRFGHVVLAATVNLSLKDLHLGSNTEKNRSFLVAAKKLKPDADEGLVRSFHEEVRFLSRLKHANVVRLLGVCSTPHSSFYIVEYMENGDLHEFLRKQKLVSDSTTHLQEGEATPLILLYMAVQIASGMRYLASRRFVHRDLATRNCLVGKEFVIKISDFGMSQVLYESFYYRVQGQLILPIRWMPYESFYGKFSIKSDVWAFGVTIWEIYNMAEQEPYSEMDNAEVINDATKGRKRKLLKRPEICPQEVYDVMMRCWVHEPSVRADFEEIYSRLFLAYMTKSQEARC